MEQSAIQSAKCRLRRLLDIAGYAGIRSYVKVVCAIALSVLRSFALAALLLGNCRGVVVCQQLAAGMLSMDADGTTGCAYRTCSSKLAYCVLWTPGCLRITHV